MVQCEVYIIGIGQFEVGVCLFCYLLLLMFDVVNEVFVDVGLMIDQIDGVFSFFGKVQGFFVFLLVGIDDLIEVLGIKFKWQMGVMEQFVQFLVIGMVVMVVKEGLCCYVICFCIVYEVGGMVDFDQYMGVWLDWVLGLLQWIVLFWVILVVCWIV